MTPEQHKSSCGLIVNTDDPCTDIDGLFMSIWGVMNWFCGVASAQCVRAAAHNQVSDDWQLAVLPVCDEEKPCDSGLQFVGGPWYSVGTGWVESLTLTHCSGQIGPVLTLNSSKNTLSVILLAWNLLTTVQNTEAWSVSIKMDFRPTSVGQIKGNCGFRESSNCETVQGMFVCIFYGTVQGGAQHCHETVCVAEVPRERHTPAGGISKQWNSKTACVIIYGAQRRHGHRCCTSNVHVTNWNQSGLGGL